jgi:type II secretory pathway component GspD/PulD (secretin)
MKKNTTLSLFWGKTNLKMKLSIILIFLSILNVFPNNSYSQKRITFDMENVTIKQVLKEIKDQTGFKFLYTSNLIDQSQKISFKAKKETTPKILDRLFENTEIDYKIIEKQIVLTNKEEKRNCKR